MKKLTIAVYNCGFLLHSRNICQKLTIRKILKIIREMFVKKMRITKISVKVVYVGRR